MNITKIILLLCITVLFCGCTSILFQPVKEHQPLPKIILEEKQDFEFNSFDNTLLHGWYFPSRKNPQKPKHTVLFLHGNAINISSHVGGIFWMPDFDIETYIFDYRGYGKSENIAYLEGILMDVEYAIGYVLSRLEKGQKLWIIGHSIGASLGLYTASQSMFKNRIQGFIAVSPFSDYQKVAQDFMSRNWGTWLFQWPLSFTINNDYRPIKFIQELSPIPVYFIHGKNDNIIESYHSEVLYEKAEPPKEIQLFDTKHNDIFANRNVKEYIVEILRVGEQR